MDIIHYNKAYEITVSYDSLAEVVDKVHGTGYPLGRSTFGRVAVLIPSGRCSPARNIRYTAFYKNPVPNDKLFISSGSKIPRDLIRQTGYRIVRDINQADYVVIPEPEETSPFESKMFWKSATGAFYIVHIIDKADGSFYITSDRVQAIELTFQSMFGEGQSFWATKGLECYFIRDIPEYSDLLNSSKIARYAFDTKLRLQPSTTISPENLDILRRMPDKSNALKILMTSNFQKYPLTICMFLDYDLSVSYGYKYGDQVNWMMKAIHYDRFEEGEDLRIPITPEDFNMLQDWIFYRIGLTGPGLFSMKVLNNLPTDYTRLLLYKVAAKKFELTKPVSYDTLKKLIENSK